MPTARPTHYARNGDIHIAYQVFGAGPLDLVVVPGFLSHLELQWDQDPLYRAWIRRLASFARVIVYDSRCSGLSDRDVGASTLDERVADLAAVLDAVGCHGCALLGIAGGGALAMAFADRHSGRVTALVLCSAFASVHASDPPGVPARLERLRACAAEWGSGQTLEVLAPSQTSNPVAMPRAARLERGALSPRALRAMLAEAEHIDVAALAPRLQRPTLVLHRTNDAVVPVELGRWLGFNIAQARFIESLSADHLPWSGDSVDEDLDEIQQFLTGSKPDMDANRFLATALFADIVNSTGQLARLGDRAWGEQLARYYDAMRAVIKEYKGQEIDTAGDGFFVVFSLPARAVRCAAAAVAAVRAFGIELRAGVHTGECQRQGDNVVGIAVHTAARIMALAQPGEILVSRTLTDLVAGSGLVFRDTGIHVLKNVPGEWRLFCVDDGAAPVSEPANLHEPFAASQPLATTSTF